MEYEWYADIFFLTNFLMDFAAVSTAAACCGRRLRPGYAAACCALAVLLNLLLFVFCPGLFLYRLLVHAALNPLLVACVFRPRQRGEFFRLLLTVYLTVFFMGGVQESVCLRTGGNGRIVVCGLAAAAAFAVYLLRRRRMRYVCEVDLWLSGKKVTVRAYCDSGNLLQDPDSGRPVSILDRQVMRQWDTGQIHTTKVPYRTISENEAYLEVVTLDKMDIYLQGTVRQIKEPRIGLSPGKIMQRPPVQMLLHASYMNG